MILTLALAPTDQARFDRLRALHFPPKRNHIPAHVTLFHHLPGAHIGAVRDAILLRSAAQAPFAIAVTGLQSLGRGTAFTLVSPDLASLRARLAETWADWLSPQDRQGFRPHITIQNKVAPSQAHALLASLRAEFSPFSIVAEGLNLWRYRGGPWEAAGRFPFTPRPPASRS